MAQKKLIVETPHGKVFTIGGPGLKATSKLEWNGGIDRFNIQFKNAQEWLDIAVVTDCKDYVPMQTGALYKTGQLGTTPGEGVVQWIAPYARYLYYGRVMVDAATGKGPMHYIDKYGNEVVRFRKGARLRRTSRELDISKAEHPLAQAFWFEAAKTQKKAVWIRGVQQIAGGR